MRPGNSAAFAAREPVPVVGRGSFNSRRLVAEDFAVKAKPGPVRVIGVVPGKIITGHLTRQMPETDGALRADLAQDVVKVSVIERHGKHNGIATGFVHGFGMRRGAIASSVGHDSHNICVVGASDADMAVAVNHLRAMGGGFVVVRDGSVLAEPIAGLMSEGSFEAVQDALIPLRAAARSLGVTLGEPFLQVAFLTLPVIPHLKITDLGMVDVDRFALV